MHILGARREPEIFFPIIQPVVIPVVNKHTPWGFNNFLMHPDQRMVVLICDSGAANGIPGIGTKPGMPVEFDEAVVIIRVNDGEFEFRERDKTDITAEATTAIDQIESKNDTIEPIYSAD